MTIRQLFKARLFKARVAGFGCWLLGVAILFLDVPASYKIWASVIPAFGIGAAVLYMLHFVRCPKCGARVGQAMAGVKKFNFCPTCGVSVDTPA